MTDEPWIVFIDESGQASVKDTKTKYFSVCAAISSEVSSHIATQFLRKLIKTHFGIVKPSELHAQEIINPTSKSVWRGVPPSIRFQILRDFLKEMSKLEFSTITVLVNKEFVSPFLDSQDDERKLGPKMATKYIVEVAYSLLLERVYLEMKSRRKSFFIILDEGEKHKRFLNNPRIGEFSPYLPSLRKGIQDYILGIGLSPSFLHAGIQLADISAYLWRRIYEEKLSKPFIDLKKELETLAVKSEKGKILGYGLKIWW